MPRTNLPPLNRSPRAPNVRQIVVTLFSTA